MACVHGRLIPDSLISEGAFKRLSKEGVLADCPTCADRRNHQREPGRGPMKVQWLVSGTEIDPVPLDADVALSCSSIIGSYKER